jgi:hypothetical protein
MGSRSDNGGSWPPDGGVPDGLPELPPEWGDIVVPDDLSSLADEVAAVRAELHLDQDQTGWQRFSRRIGLRGGPRTAAGLRGPALIIAMAVLVTLASLWASAWPGPARPVTPQRTASTGETHSLPALELIGADGRPVPLRGQLPAVILLVDGCECSQLVADTAAAVRPEIAILTVISGTVGTPTVMTAGPVSPAGPPSAPGPAAATAAATPATGPVPPTGAAPAPQPPPAVRPLRDPTNELRSAFNLAAPDGNAAVLLVSRTGDIVRTVRRTATIEDIRPDLARL